MQWFHQLYEVTTATAISQLHRTHKKGNCQTGKTGTGTPKNPINSLNLFTFQNGFRVFKLNQIRESSSFTVSKIPVRVACTVCRIYFETFALLFVAQFRFSCISIFFFWGAICAFSMHSGQRAHTANIGLLNICGMLNICIFRMLPNGLRLRLYDAFRLFLMSDLGKQILLYICDLKMHKRWYCVHIGTKLTHSHKC